MDLLIMECTPKGDKASEGEILKRFLTLPDFIDDVKINLVEYTNKSDFLNYLYRHICLNRDYNLIHLSGHGWVEDKETAFFYLPRGSVKPDEFPRDCFMGTNVGISACELGKTAFIDPFIKQTCPVTILGPQKVVNFSDACLFWINYYSRILHHNYKPLTAYQKTIYSLKKDVRGSFQFFNNNFFELI